MQNSKKILTFATLYRSLNMEQLLHYVWKHKLWPLHPLATTDGRSIEIIDTGLHNTDAGPDFFNAKIKLDGQLWVGNIEIHTKASDWFRHHHQDDTAYNSVILHVVEQADMDATDSTGRILPTLCLSVPHDIEANYEELQRSDRYPPCHKIIATLPKLFVHSWINRLEIERLERKTSEISRRVELCQGSWEAACFVTLARNFGFGVNSDAFEEWAMNIDLAQASHHRDEPLQIEALFMGQAGLLDTDSMPQRHRSAAQEDEYFVQLSNEYRFLKHKYGLTPMSASRWRFLRMRPQNFPYIRLSQLAVLYCSHRATLSRLVECSTMDDVRRELTTAPQDYWQTHYLFGAESKSSSKQLSKASIDLIAINTVVPILFAYGRHSMKEQLEETALTLLENIKAEDNTVVRMWHECGLDASSAADTQALLQLKRQYCDRKDCLRCRIGYEYLKKKR